MLKETAIRHHKHSNHSLYSPFIHPTDFITPIDILLRISDDFVLSCNFSIKDKALTYDKEGETKSINNLQKCVQQNNYREQFTNLLGFIEAIENLYDITDSLSSKHTKIKMVIAEFERILEHLTWTYELLVNSGILHLSNTVHKLKILIKDLLDHSIGIKSNKFSKCLNVGFLDINWTPEFSNHILSNLEEIDYTYNKLKTKILSNTILKKLLVNIGIMESNLAEKIGTIGPIARASGLIRDLRVDDPYWDYLSLGKVKIAISYDQDLYGILNVKLNEIQDSFAILHKEIKQIKSISPENKLNEVDMRQYGHTSIRIETANGPTIYQIHCSEKMIINGFGMSSPALTNLNSLETRLIGQPLEHVNRIIHAYNLIQFGLTIK